MGSKPLQWHPAFQATLQIEFLEDLEFLDFHMEYNLSEKPLQVDTLVIKRKPGVLLKKSIGRLFREHNIIEYKSPGDYLSINDFYKTLGYACIYQSNTTRVMEIPPQELTITLISSRYPRDLITHLTSCYGATFHKEEPGIYYVQGLPFPVQILIGKDLNPKEYLWLSRLRRGLTVEQDIAPLADAYRGKEKNPLYAAAMDIIIRANQKQYKEGSHMCAALEELIADQLIEHRALGIAEGESRGRIEGCIEGRIEGCIEGRIEGCIEGLAKGKSESILELLAELGAIPESLSATILEQKDTKLLSSWLKLAAKAESLENFMAGI